MFEINPLTDEMREIRESVVEDVYLDDPRLRRIVRLRLLSDPGFPMWDLSYCYGQLHDGTYVRVDLPVWQFRKGRLNGDLIEMCRRAGVYGKGLGLFDGDVISTLT